MAIIEVGVNSYVTEAELATYATDRGITITATNTAPLLIKAMDYIDTRNFIGSKTDSTQALQFPRVFDINYSYYDVPVEIKKAQMIAAILIDEGNDLQAVMTQAIKSEKVDVLEITYQDGTISYAQFTALNDILRQFTQSAIRGTRI